MSFDRASARAPVFAASLAAIGATIVPAAALAETGKGKHSPAAHSAAKRGSVHSRPMRRAYLTRQGHAVAPPGAPWEVRRVIQAANRIASRPYQWGGGHGSFYSWGYDCSGSVSYALHGAKLVRSPRTSSSLMSYGRSGRGKWITIYANGGHTYMVVAGLRFDTAARKWTKSRWTRHYRSHNGYVARHPGRL
jgi:cell wall-associated NlpC family hydrolase